MTSGWWTPRRWSAAGPGRRSRRSDAAGWAEYGYCASHSRYFWGLRLHLVCTLSGLPVLFALAGAKADERETLLGMLEAGRDVADDHPGQTLIGDKNYFGRDFEAELTERELVLLRPARKGEARRAGQELFKPLRQVIESVNWTFKGQLDLERHGGRTPGGHHRPGPGPHPRADRRDLAQRQDQPASQEITDRLRPLTVTRPPGIIHLVTLVPRCAPAQATAGNLASAHANGTSRAYGRLTGATVGATAANDYSSFRTELN